MTPFDLIQSPLDGVNLIEASAGTGKTYTIAGLYLRLVLEKKMPVEKILVVTFTEAATEELKDRIRRRLKEAEIGFEKGSSDDPLLRTCLEHSVSVSDDLERLRNAVRSFDQAAVFTIHGFCQRMLIENAFESGSLFETELMTDTSNLVLEITRDYVRTSVYGLNGLFADYLNLKKIGPDSLASFLKKVMKPGLRFVHTPDFVDTTEEEQQLQSLYNRLKETWFSDRQTLLTLLSDKVRLNQRSYGPGTIAKWAVGLDRYLSGIRPGLQRPDTFTKGCSSSIAAGTKKGQTPPSHLFFDLCDEYHDVFKQLDDLFASNHIHFKQKALAFVERQLEKTKAERGILFFDDLLTRLFRKLEQDPGGLLASRIRSAYGAALIDEFQDTDPVQYAIFSRVFAQGDTPLFMIGDPKQAIYGFRGADIFAYLKAVRQAKSAYTLGRNYRSDPALVEAVNLLFHRVEHPFVFPEIAFYPATALEKNQDQDLVIEGGDPRDTSPMTVLLFPGSEKELNKREANTLARKAVAGEMARLLHLGRKGQARLGSRNLEPRDMAVLVRTNAEAADMNESLNNLGIPSVIHDTGNVFQSHEALELERVLSAVLHPGDSGLIKAALATDMLGKSALDLFHAGQEEERFEAWTDSFRHWHTLWTGRGFSAMFQAVVKDWDVKARLMILDRGHRRNTNLFHLAQLLHEADLTSRGGAAVLLEWFRKQRVNPEDNEEHQLRLEQDAEAVTIVTIHKSKGMEYPLVFLPFLWSQPNQRNKDKEPCVFHDGEDRQLFCDLGSDRMAFHRTLADRENLAESLRVLYVALTRAKKRCWVVWGRASSSSDTAFARLVYTGLEDKDKPADDGRLEDIFKAIGEESNGLIQAVHANLERPLPFDRKNGAPTALNVRSWSGRIESDFRITSFSSLTSRRDQGSEVEARDRDRARHKEPVEVQAEREQVFMDFPRGARPGTFLHDIFEHLDFTWSEEEAQGLVREKLEAYGYESFWLSAVSTMVRNVLHTPLAPEDPCFTFSTVTNPDRLNELEFYFPLSKIRSENLSDVLARHGRTVRVGEGAFSQNRFEFQPVKGFMRGFMDLVFRRRTGNVARYFIVDWKSNFLGTRLEDYSPDNLGRVMVEESYDLQYLLYTLALDRYLRLKLGDSYDYTTHFGGVFYVFLRGVKPEGQGTFGIFRDRPDPELIRDLSRLFWGGK